MTFPNPHERRASSFYFALGFLLCLLTALGWFLVPRSWNSIWMDREFSTWVAPVANQITPTAKLYDDGLHLPLPPLPYVAMHVLSGGKATWLMESEANFIFQGGTLIALFLAFNRLLGLDVACASVLATLPIFFALPKAIVYDSLTQFFAASAGSLAIILFLDLGRQTDVSPPSRSVRTYLLSIGVGLITGILILCKQSTGTGLALGITFLFLAFPTQLPFRGKLYYLTLIGVTSAASIFFLSLCLSPWIDVKGFYHDVFVIGSEPKGGGLRLIHSVFSFSIRMVGSTLIYVLPVLLAYFFFRPVREVLQKHFVELKPQIDSTPSFYLMAILGSAVGLGAVFAFGLHGIELPSIVWVPGIICDVALTVSLIAVLATLISSFSQYKFPVATHPATAFVIVFLPAAIFHNVSDTILRWHYDNNPFIAASFAVLFCVLLSILKRYPKKHRHVNGASLIVFLLIGALSPSMSVQVHDASQCVEKWPDIPYLSGVRMRPSADGIHQLVQFAESYTTPEDQILLLPDDPNFRAFFDRPVPHLSCATIFVDQYWDRYVEADYIRLAANPPKIIIIGPRLFWRRFSRRFHTNWGTERLIDKVVDDLLPHRYTLARSQIISHQGKTDYMDVFIRQD